jgi:hypothetical protein
MFRKIRIRRRLLVVGLGLAALTAPATALAGGYSAQGLKALITTSQAENNRYGGQDGYALKALQAMNAKGEAMNQRYGTSQYGAPDGWTPYVEQLTRESQSPPVLDGRSPDTKDFAVLAHEPVVTITKTQGFQWDDFGIGTGVALAAVILLAVSLRFLSNRQDRKPGSVVTA